jgi:hypothetical protein
VVGGKLLPEPAYVALELGAMLRLERDRLVEDSFEGDEGRYALGRG